MTVAYDELGLLFPNDSTFWITVTNYSLDVDYQLYDEVTQSPADSTSSTSVRVIESFNFHSIVIAAVAAAAVILIIGHVVVTCRKRSRRQTWSVQSTARTARGRFIQRDIWTGTATRRPDSSQHSTGSDPFHTDIYRTLAYAYINWKQDMTSVPGSCRSSSSTSESSEKRIGARNSQVSESVTSYSSRTDDVTLPSSLTGDMSLTSSASWRHQTSSSGQTCIDKTGNFLSGKSANSSTQDISPTSNCSSAGQFCF